MSRLSNGPQHDAADRLLLTRLGHLRLQLVETVWNDSDLERLALSIDSMSHHLLAKGRSYNLHTLKIRGLASGLVFAAARFPQGSASTQDCACANKAMCSADRLSRRETA